MRCTINFYRSIITAGIILFSLLANAQYSNTATTRQLVYGIGGTSFSMELPGYNVVAVTADSSGYAVPLNPSLWIVFSFSSAIYRIPDLYWLYAVLGWTTIPGFGYYGYDIQSPIILFIPNDPSKYSHVNIFLTR